MRHIETNTKPTPRAIQFAQPPCPNRQQRPLWAYPRALGLSAVTLVVLESVLALIGVRAPALVAAVIALAPGLAIAPVLPVELLRPATVVAIVPALGLAASSITFVTISALGVSLTALTLRISLVVLVAIPLALQLSMRRSCVLYRPSPWGAELRVLVGLVGVVLLAIGLQSRTIGGAPVPGSDWGHYLLYADQIARHQSILVTNPYWMGGTPFAEDPATPSVYGAFLILGRGSEGVLLHGIWLYAVVGILSVFVCLRSLWNDLAALAGSAMYAAIPMNQDVLAWHGLATVAGLCYVPLVLMAAVQGLRGRRSLRWSFVLALTLVALAATHRLTFALTALCLVLALALGLMVARRGIVRFAARTAGVVVVLGIGVVIGLVRQADAVGATQSYSTYNATRVSGRVLDLALRDLSWPVLAAVIVGVMTALTFSSIRRDRALLIVAGLAGAIVAFSYAWVAHVPSDYTRPLYYLPLLAVLIIAGTLSVAGRLPVVVITIAVVVWAGALAWHDAPLFRRFYSFVTPASVRGIAYLDRVAPSGAVILTDRCWAFAAEWLLRRPVYAALEPYDNFAAHDAPLAAAARSLLYAGQGQPGPVTQSAYAIVDPLCTASRGVLPPPRLGTPIFESTTAVILRLKPRDAGPVRPNR